jgi:hypothetical protein
MQRRTNVCCRLLSLAAVLSGTVALSACWSDNAFQPLADGAQPWKAPAGWNPFDNAPGYVVVGNTYIAICSCPGCSGISYALCNDGLTFDQCVCGSSFYSGAACPSQWNCSDNDYPPQGWSEFNEYTGPGFAGNENQCLPDAGL